MSVAHAPVEVGPDLRGNRWVGAGCVVLLGVGWGAALGWRWWADSIGIGFGPFGDAVFRVLFVLALLLSVPLLVRVWRRRWVWRGLGLAVVVLLAVAGGLVWSGASNVVAWYQFHRADFLAVGRISTLSTVDGSSVRLPGGLAALSGTGELVSLGANNGKAIAYLPVWAGLPDCSEGYAWFSGPIESRYRGGDLLDGGFGCALVPQEPVGDGWWFVA